LPVPQAYLHAGAEAAVAALVAHHERERSGLGQHVDVSAQQAVALATQAYILCDTLEAPDVRRSAGGLKHGRLTLRLLFPARDGFVAITFLFGSAIGQFSRRLMHWIHEEGGCDRATRDRARALSAVGHFALRQRDYDEAERLKGPRIHRALDESRGLRRAQPAVGGRGRGRSVASRAQSFCPRDYWRTCPARSSTAMCAIRDRSRFGASPIRYRRPRRGRRAQPRVYQGEQPTTRRWRAWPRRRD
jgi:hypothetical protein